MADDIGTFHRFARLYELVMLPPDRGALSDALASAERPLERVLDVGGGPGRAVSVVDVPTRVVVDPARGMLERARRRGLGALQADGARLPVAAESVDAILVSDALHHVGDRDGLLADAARALRPGGVLVVREFDPTTLRGRLLAAGEHLVGFESVFESPDELATRVAAVGLLPTVSDRGFTYTLVGTRPRGAG